MRGTAFQGAWHTKGWLTGALGDAWKLVKHGTSLSADGDSPLSAEIAELAAPHLAVLAHKRARLYESLELAGERRWQSELHAFVARVIVPGLARTPGAASADALVEIMDMIVADAQANGAKAGVPVTSRFDTSWAM